MGQLTDAESMFDGSGLNTANYNQLLIGWASQETQAGVPFGAEGIYCTDVAAQARAILEDERDWLIVDGGLVLGAGGAPP